MQQFASAASRALRQLLATKAGHAARARLGLSWKGRAFCLGRGLIVLRLNHDAGCAVAYSRPPAEDPHRTALPSSSGLKSLKLAEILCPSSTKCPSVLGTCLP